MKKDELILILLGMFAIPMFVTPEFSTGHPFAQRSAIEYSLRRGPFDHVGLDDFQGPPVESVVAAVSGTVRS
jgi:hypothetical protein